jgi:hypothetical protein
MLTPICQVFEEFKAQNFAPKMQNKISASHAGTAMRTEYLVAQYKMKEAAEKWYQ